MVEGLRQDHARGSPSTDPVIQVEGLCYTYPGGHQALRDLHLLIRAGRRIALVGPNGAGKTTLLLHLNGVLRPTSGVVKVAGEPVSYRKSGLTRVRQTVVVVFQDPEAQLFAGNVYQDVSFGPLNLGLPEHEVRSRVEEALVWLDIVSVRDQPIHMLSFGQKKRVAIAGAVAMRPQVLVLDEPTSGLDPGGASQLMHLLENLGREGSTIVIATHDMDLAYEWADEVAILSEGRVVAQGPPHELMSDPGFLDSYGLRVPWLVEVGGMLKELGLLPVDSAPRSLFALRTALANRQRELPELRGRS